LKNFKFKNHIYTTASLIICNDKLKIDSNNRPILSRFRFKTKNQKNLLSFKAEIASSLLVQFSEITIAAPNEEA